MPKQILLVDDSVTIHRVVEITFAREDCTITAVKSGDEGIARARDLKPDLVLADAGMTGKNGYDVCAAIKAEAAQVPCLILTGNFNPYDEAKGQKAGADGFVVKPFETQALIDKVNDLLKRGGSVKSVAAAAAPAAAPPAPSVSASPKPPVPTAVPIPQPPRPAPSPPVPSMPNVIEPLSKPLSVVAQETAAKPPLPMPIPQPAPRPPVPAPGGGGSERRTMMGFPAVTPAGLVPPIPPAPAPAPAPMSVAAAPVAVAEAQVVMPADVPQMPRPSMIPHTATPQPKAAAPAPVKMPTPPPRATLMGIPAVNPNAVGAMPPGAVALPPSPPPKPAWQPPVPVAAAPPPPVAPPPAPAPAPSNDHAHAHASPTLAAAVSEIAARGPEYAALANLSREVLEKIAWEVVPELAEIIIKEQLDRLVKERQS